MHKRIPKLIHLQTAAPLPYSQSKTSAAAAAASPPPLDITSHLPLRLLKSKIIASAPYRSASESEPTIDFLSDFVGHSWIAYGASSLVIISHFPNPLLKAETKIGTVHRQVVELSREADIYVSTMCWFPTTPSADELTVASGLVVVRGPSEPKSPTQPSLLLKDALT